MVVAFEAYLDQSKIQTCVMHLWAYVYVPMCSNLLPGRTSSRYTKQRKKMSDHGPDLQVTVNDERRRV